MDFHSLSRRDLQTLCKKNRIPANITNVAMADALQALEMIEGIEELQEALKFQSPKTSQRTASRKPVGPAEDQASPLPGSRRVTARAPGALKLLDEEEKKEDAVETVKAPNTKRRTSKKEVSNEVVETPATRRTTRTSKRTSAVQGAEAQKEEKPVGLTTGRRRGTVKKEVDLLSGGARSSRVRGITTMASLAKEEVEEEKEAGEVAVETTEERVDEKDKEQEKAAKVDDKAEKQEEENVDDIAGQVEEKGAGDIVDQKKDLCSEEAAVDAKNEEIIDEAVEQAEEKQMKEIVEEEIKPFDQTSFNEVVMAEGDFVDQTNDLQSEEMKAAETKEDKMDDKEEEKEERNDEQVEEKLDDKAEEEEEKLEVQVEEEEEKLGDKPEQVEEKIEEQVEEKLDEKAEEEEEQTDEHAEEKLEVQVVEEEEKLDDKPEQEEQQTVDQAEQEQEKEMKDIVGDEIKSPVANTCYDLLEAADEESVNQKNVLQYEEMAGVETVEEVNLDDVAQNNDEKLEADDATENDDEKKMNDAVEEEVKPFEEKKAKTVEECSELVVVAAAIIAEDSPIRGLITAVEASSNTVAEEAENIEKSSEENEIDEEFNLQEQPISEEGKKETGNMEISSPKEEIKLDVGALREENDVNKENTTSVKSKTKKNYKDMSLRQLKAAYKEVLLTTNNKGEEKRAALKVIQENRI